MSMKYGLLIRWTLYLGFINSYDGSYGNLAYSGTLQNMTNLGSCYCFRLRHGLNIVDGNNNYVTSLAAGNMVYTKSATAGASDEKYVHYCL